MLSMANYTVLLVALLWLLLLPNTKILPLSVLLIVLKPQNSLVQYFIPRISVVQINSFLKLAVQIHLWFNSSLSCP